MHDLSHVELERKMIRDAQAEGSAATVTTYIRLSGPGWLQGAITLGGGSLAGSLYLGVIMGYRMMWLQPVAMILGVVMLSAISYVTLSTGLRPFKAINEHISPLLGWGWLIATLMANVVWCLPQFALGTAAIQQNLLPASNNDVGKTLAALSLLVVATIVVWFYNSGSRGIKIFELILKAMVGVVVLSFFGVVIAMTVHGALDWPKIFAGFIPDLNQLFSPAASLQAFISETSDPDWWTKQVSDKQRDKIITAFATAVGINMTFLLPYSMLRKGWDKDHRGLAIFDLSIGLIVPFVLATGCVVIAAASQFHGKYDDVTQMLKSGKGKEVNAYHAMLDKRLKVGHADALAAADNQDDRQELLASLRETAPEADRRLAAMLAERDNLALAKTLAPLVGNEISQKLFGIGVLGMALSTIIILMLINGFVVCEMVGQPDNTAVHRLGSLIPGLGILGPFYWSQAAPALATPTSVFAGAMLPIAYLAFLLLMNSRKVLGDAMPTGAQRVRWNIAMSLATGVAAFGSIWGLMNKTYEGFPIGKVAIAALFVLLALGVSSFVAKNRQ